MFLNNQVPQIAYYPVDQGQFGGGMGGIPGQIPPMGLGGGIPGQMGGFGFPQ
jgi:hypothetical protein